jgi:BTB/POZ domain
MVTSQFELEASEPDRKRPRIDEPSSSQLPPNFANHPTLYFGDGNVILRCQKTYFRVHRTLLTRNSPVFRDILAEHDRDNGEQFRGCILLTLDDDVDDMEQLLNRVYDGLYVLSRPASFWI